MRGNYTRRYTRRLTYMGSPPRARELLVYTPFIAYVAGITPACAGITLFFNCDCVVTWDHPRVRGNYLSASALSLTFVGSPPRARELRLLSLQVFRFVGITPACAGITIAWIIHSLTQRDHPRVRGNYEFYNGLKVQVSGSPPRARELPLFDGINHCSTGITPACAGITCF